MKCIIIEDQPPAQRILKKYIADIGTLELIGVFPDAIQAMSELNNRTIDLIFLDIHLPKLSGIDFLKTLKNPPAVILTTAFADYALESYEFNVIDYLLKPFSFQRFVQAVSKVSQKSEKGSEDVNDQSDAISPREIFVKSGYDRIKIDVNDILFIKSDADYTEVHLSGKKHLSSEPLRKWLDILHKSTFVRVHKSYVINTSQILKVSGNQIYIKSVDFSIPIGRTYKEEFISQFINV